jgi:hypothetical protein
MGSVMDESRYYLLDRFYWDKEEEEFFSKKKWIGATTGDDSILRMYTTKTGTIIYWRDNRGQEQTIFDGRALSKKEMEQVFELLEINKYLKWKIQKEQLEREE